MNAGNHQEALSQASSQAGSQAGSEASALAECAFDHAEAGHLAVARALAERALALDPRGAGAAHALAHVLYEERDWQGGAAFLAKWLERYPSHAPDHSHLSCHLAQFELWRGAGGDAHGVLGVYRQRLDPERVQPTHVRLRDAAAILWRLSLTGSTSSLPWQPLRALAEPIIRNPDDGLDAVHAAMVLAATNDAAGLTRLVYSLRRLAEHGHPTAGNLVLHLVRAIEAYATARYGVVIDHLKPVVHNLLPLGGSNAQREVFGEMLVRARVMGGARWDLIASNSRRSGNEALHAVIK